MQKHVHTLIIGSGAAGLAAAVHLRRLGVEDILIATESLAGGTSMNTGSDKQTYYKMACCGAEADSVREMAQTYFAGGSMHGDLALAEAAGSLRAFMNLVELGVPFPRDEYGQFVGYKTDHDPRQRATSCGPYTSREMCRALIREVKRLQVTVQEGVYVRELLTVDLPGEDVNQKPGMKFYAKREFAADHPPVRKRVTGAMFADVNGEKHAVYANYIIFAVGGPGGIYKTSVYPEVHHGAIGVALAAGAVAQNLSESQFGMASTKFRWNVSGTYMQCVPRFVSTGANGVCDEREFLSEKEIPPAELHSLIFLKGYQWPFDARKIHDMDTDAPGSSVIDTWVYEETVLRNRRVFLDFRQNPAGFHPESLTDEAKTYLMNSGALALPTPLARLEKMNPAAVRLYAEHGIDLTREPLEIAVCAQHNNGGLAADVNWQSVNLRGLFPIGEVNGSHGVYRPGGSALNAGQVGALRAAEFIARQPGCEKTAQPVTDKELTESENAGWRAARDILQERMSRCGAFIRRKPDVEQAIEETREQLRNTPFTATEMESHRNAYLLVTQLLMLDAIGFQLDCNVGSRGSAIVFEKDHIIPENPEFRRYVLESWLDAENQPRHRWMPRREIPEPDSWFENVWARFNEELGMRNEE